jgi:hypothetical protein
LTEADLASLRYGVLDLARQTLDRLLHDLHADLPPSTLWTPNLGDPERIVGSTMFWADHYLIGDTLLDVLMRDPVDRSELERQLLRLLRIRPLLETALIVPVPFNVAEVLVADQATVATQRDLSNRQLMSWLRQQIHLAEGPTARQVIFFEARDDDEERTRFYLYAEIVKAEERRLSDGSVHTLSRLLGPYRAEFDYGPWINQSKRRAAVEILGEINTHLAIAELFGGHLLATSPFRGRLLTRKGGTVPSPAQMLMWADVPAVIDGDVGKLARIAADNELVESLRSSVRRAFRNASASDPEMAGQKAREYIDDISRQATLLQRQLTSDKWTRNLITTVTVAGLAVAATQGLIAGIAAAAAGVPPLLDLRRRSKQRRRNAAYALLIGGKPAHQAARQRSGESELAGAELTHSVLTR